jgi:signal peptidase I
VRASLLTKIAAGGLGLLLLAAGWFFLAPRQLGGAASYAAISGVSMEPRLHAGELAILRERSSYHVGDVVGYRNAQLHRIVLHRIVRQNGDRYVFKGDNNDFLDPGVARQSDMVGELWVAVPGLGHVLRLVRTPWLAGLVIALAAFFAFGGGLVAKARRRLRPTRTVEAPLPPRQPSPRPVAPAGAEDLRRAGTVMVVLLAAAGVFGLLALSAFARPAKLNLLDRSVYTQRGSFDYSGTASSSVAYENDRVRSGDPLFFNLLHDVSVGFEYKLDAADARDVRGTAALSAVLADGRGWRRTIVLEPQTSFTGSAVALRGTLDLDRIQSLLHLFQEQTGVEGDSYSLRIVPRVQARGVVADAPVSTSYAPALAFRVDTNGMQLDTKSLDRSDPGALPRTVSNHLPKLLFGLPVGMARLIGGLGLLAALAGALLAYLRITRGRSRDEAAWIEARYGSLLVSGSARHRLWDETVVTVDSFDALARIARTHDRLVLHERVDGGHLYSLEDAGVLYRYELGGRRSDSIVPLRVRDAA